MQRSWEDALPDELAEFAEQMEQAVVSCTALAADEDNESLQQETDRLIEEFIAKGASVGQSRGNVLFSIHMALDDTPERLAWEAAAYAIKSGPFRIQLYHGCIGDEALEAHTLVNPTNPAVGIGSGVSGAIAKLGVDNEFQEETQESFRTKFPDGGELEEGDFLCSWAPLTSNFRQVVHVVTVNYKKGLTTNRDRVFKAMKAALEGAEQLAYYEENLQGIQVVATPILGAGHGGLTSIQALDEMMRAIRATLELHSIRAVKLVIPEARDITVAKYAAEKHALPIEPITTLL